MKRRNFLMNAAALASAGALPAFALAKAASSSADKPRFTLAQLDSSSGAFMAVRGCSASGCTDDSVRLRFDAFHAAEPAPVLRALRVHALFDVAGAPQTPYIVWDYRASSDAGNSRGVSFVAGRECMRGLALDYRLDDASPDALRTHLALTHLDAPILHPGHYLLASPRRDGRAADLDGLRYSGSPEQPVLARAGEALAFDYLAFRIEALG